MLHVVTAGGAAHRIGERRVEITFVRESQYRVYSSVVRDDVPMPHWGWDGRLSD